MQQTDLQGIFDAGGSLARALKGFVPRRQQLHMAQGVADALEDRRTLVIEAGTGTGKTFAYLVPVLLSGLRVLVSTGTRTLQDQLFEKDLPLLSGALGLPVHVAVLKGRGNYLCLQRLEQAQLQQTLRGGGLLADTSRGLADRILAWAARTTGGDLSEVSDFADSHPLWPQITSTRDNCLGQQCPEYGRCHLVKARREAQEAQVVIVNHHLLLADLTLKEDGFGDVLGAADAVVIDEAHQLPDLAMQFFGASCSARGLTHVLNAVRAAGAESANIKFALSAVDERVNAVGATLASRSGRTPWEQCPPELTERAEDLAHAMSALAAELEALPEDSTAKGLTGRVVELAAQLTRIAAVTEVEGARSADAVTAALCCICCHLKWRTDSRRRCGHGAAPGSSRRRRCPWARTSATSRPGWAWEPPRPCAFPVRLTSNARACCGYPKDCRNRRPRISSALLDASAPLIDAARGGAFILFTSHRALSAAAMYLRAQWSAAGSGTGCSCKARRPASSCCAAFATTAMRCCWVPPVSGKEWTSRGRHCGWSSSKSCRLLLRKIRSSKHGWNTSSSRAATRSRTISCTRPR